ncbi:hypothetical protein E2562_010228 [Oryza meyeriana var. granulata]|uniref:Uncharacterized protein n=1 Tax=Oryza meyeriana var. granulata TaxID=110450 RepID=A0A6G1EJN3_9ORYZ|nr:hypothetical protein E2562_010228 [Oryza meyeriana var. granulata]
MAKHLATPPKQQVHVVKKENNAHESSDTEDDYPNANHWMAHIFSGSTSYVSKKEYKKVECQVCTTSLGIVTKLAWSNVPVTFSDANHPAVYTTPRRYLRVVKPTIKNIKVAHVMIVGGSSINLLFVSALDAMGIPRSELKPSEQPSHGITLESSSKPLGKITLPVTFGEPDNFRIKQIMFDGRSTGRRTAADSLLTVARRRHRGHWGSSTYEADANISHEHLRLEAQLQDEEAYQRLWAECRRASPGERSTAYAGGGASRYAAFGKALLASWGCRRASKLSLEVFD